MRYVRGRATKEASWIMDSGENTPLRWEKRDESESEPLSDSDPDKRGKEARLRPKSADVLVRTLSHCRSKIRRRQSHLVVTVRTHEILFHRACNLIVHHINDMRVCLDDEFF